MATVIQFRRGSRTYMAGEGSQVILQEGEPFLEYPDTGIDTPGSKMKIGDGISRYCDLPYFENNSSSGGSSKTSDIIKKKYLISNSSWSSSPDSDGYYEYTLNLKPQLDMSFAPNIYIANADDNKFPAETEEQQYNYIKYASLITSNRLILYADQKPSLSFYIYVEGILENILSEAEFLELLNNNIYNSSYIGSKVVIKNDHWKNSNNNIWVIADVSHDPSQPNSYDLILENCLISGYMSESDNPSWRTSDIRNRLNHEYYNAFSSDIKSHMLRMNYQYDGTTYNDDYIIIPSAIEVGATDLGDYAVEEGSMYPIFTSSSLRTPNDSRIKVYGDGSDLFDGAQGWWLRTKKHDSSSVQDTDWFHVGADGAVAFYSSSNRDFVIPVMRLH